MPKPLAAMCPTRRPTRPMPRMPKVSSFSLHAAERVPHPLELRRLVHAVAEERPRPQELQRVADDKVADREGVRVRRVDDLDAAGTAGRHVDVLEADAAAADDFELRGSGQESGVHLGVGAHHQAERIRQGGVEFGGIRRRLDDSGSLFQPGERRRIGVFSNQDEW